MSQGKSDDFKEKYAVLKERNNEYKSDFFYGVRTTGIFCRTNCSSRLPNPENVIFFKTIEDALKEGYRPCKRCRPLEEPESKKNDLVSEICRIIEESEDEPTLAVLAEKTSYSQSSVQKTFTQLTGISPKQYAKTIKAERFKKNLRQDTSITSAIYSSGYTSSSRVYENRTEMLAMTPSQFKNSGEGLTIRMDVFPCSLGFILIAFTDKGISNIELGDSKEALISEFRIAFKNAELQSLKTHDGKIVNQILLKIQNPRKKMELPLDIHGTIFQRQVWNELKKIPAGETRTYRDIAESIGNPKSTRAVAKACAKNSIAVLIPCHRVIRMSGELAGYKWGVERKKQLLEMEMSCKKKAGPGQDQP